MYGARKKTEIKVKIKGQEGDAATNGLREFWDDNLKGMMKYWA